MLYIYACMSVFMPVCLSVCICMPGKIYKRLVTSILIETEKIKCYCYFKQEVFDTGNSN